MTPRAPLLTREHAEILYATNYDKWPQTRDPLDELRKGRTAVAHVLSEEECRAEFEAWYFLHAWKLPTPAEIWLASRRALGLIKEPS